MDHWKHKESKVCIIIATVNILCGGLVGINHLYLRRGKPAFQHICLWFRLLKALEKKGRDHRGIHNHPVGCFDAKVICYKYIIQVSY